MPRNKQEQKIALFVRGMRVGQPEGRKLEASLPLLRFDLRSPSFLCNGFATGELWHLPEDEGAISRKMLGGCLNYSPDAAIPKAIRKDAVFANRSTARQGNEDVILVLPPETNRPILVKTNKRLMSYI